MFYLVTQLPLTNIQQSYPSINPLPLSSWFCKLWMYSDWGLVNTSPMIILYISVERLVNVKFTAKRLILRKNRNILIFTLIVTFINLIFYIPVCFYYYVDVSIINDTNASLTTTSLSCTISAEDNLKVSWMYLIFNGIVPYFLMIFFTLWLCYTIYQSRRRTEANRNIRKDVKFTITSISLNLAFIVLTLPESIADFYSEIFVDNGYMFCNLLFHSSYAINFYFLFAFNSVIRAEVLFFFRINNKKVSNDIILRMNTLTMQPRESIKGRSDYKTSAFVPRRGTNY
jgi:hypothetical protein